MVYSSGQSVLTPAGQQALDEVHRIFDGHEISTQGDGSGGVFVVISGLNLTDLFVQQSTWLGFQISYLYPASDVYPHYVRPDLQRRDGSPLGPGYSPILWGYRDTQAIQVSRRSNRWDPKLDSAAMKAIKVMSWINGSTR
jgi:hypothetical protein